jgi:hypothetical protein
VSVAWCGSASALWGLALRLPAACALALCCGCIATGQYKFLEADAPGAVREIGFQDYRRIIVLRSPDQVRLEPQPGMQLVVRACNRESVAAVTVGPFIPIIPWPPSIVLAWTTTPPPPLLVSIDFAAGVGFSFDPAQVTVRTREGSIFRPAAFAVQSNRGPCSFAPHGPLPAQPLYVRGPLAVMLQFDLRDLPAQPFVVEIGGISSGGVTVEVPPITLKHGSEWILYPFSS